MQKSATIKKRQYHSLFPTFIFIFPVLFIFNKGPAIVNTEIS